MVLFYDAPGLTLGQRYTFSVEAAAGTFNQVQLQVFDSGTAHILTPTLTASLVRYSITWTPAATTDQHIFLGWQPNGGSAFTINGKNVILARPMLNTGASPCRFKPV